MKKVLSWLVVGLVLAGVGIVLANDREQYSVGVLTIETGITMLPGSTINGSTVLGTNVNGSALVNGNLSVLGSVVIGTNLTVRGNLGKTTVITNGFVGSTQYLFFCDGVLTNQTHLP